MMPLEAVSEIYETCLGDARARAWKCALLARRTIWPSIRRMAHALKGGAGMVGAQKLAAAAAELELGDYQQRISLN